MLQVSLTTDEVNYRDVICNKCNGLHPFPVIKMHYSRDIDAYIKQNSSLIHSIFQGYLYVYFSRIYIYMLSMQYDSHICLYCILFMCHTLFHTVIIIHKSFVEWKCSWWMQVWGVNSWCTKCLCQCSGCSLQWRCTRTQMGTWCHGFLMARWCISHRLPTPMLPTNRPTCVTIMHALTHSWYLFE